MLAWDKRNAGYALEAWVPRELKSKPIADSDSHEHSKAIRTRYYSVQTA